MKEEGHNYLIRHFEPFNQRHELLFDVGLLDLKHKHIVRQKTRESEATKANRRKLPAYLAEKQQETKIAASEEGKKAVTTGSDLAACQPDLEDRAHRKTKPTREGI